MPLGARVLLGPGPCNPYPEATVALGVPLLGHLDPAFVAMLDETCDGCGRSSDDEPADPADLGTGSAGMEAAFVNLVGPGDDVVVGSTACSGAHVRRRARCGAEVVAVEDPWGRRSTPSACSPPTRRRS